MQLEMMATDADKGYGKSICWNAFPEGGGARNGGGWSPTGRSVAASGFLFLRFREDICLSPSFPVPHGFAFEGTS